MPTTPNPFNLWKKKIYSIVYLWGLLCVSVSDNYLHLAQQIVTVRTLHNWIQKTHWKTNNCWFVSRTLRMIKVLQQLPLPTNGNNGRPLRFVSMVASTYTFVGNRLNMTFSDGMVHAKPIINCCYSLTFGVWQHLLTNLLASPCSWCSKFTTIEGSWEDPICLVSWNIPDNSG